MKNKLQLIAAGIGVLFLSIGAHAQCTPGFTWTQTSNNVINFTNTSTPNIANSTWFNWSFGDNQYDYTTNPVHTYNAPGTYIVCLSMYDSLNMCQGQFCDSVTVYGNVLCNLSASAFATSAASCSTCADGSAYGVPQGGTAPYTFSWSNNGTGQYANNLLPGTYTFCVTDANACTACATVTILDSTQQSNCNASFTFTLNANNNVTFTNTSTGVGPQTVYMWNFGDGNYDWNANTQHTYASAGGYNVCLTIYDSATACQNTSCTYVSVNGNTLSCSANFVIYPDSVNTNQAWAYNLSTGGPNMTYDWNWGDNTPHDYVAYPSHIYQSTGSYNICLIVNDASTQCSDTMCQTIQVVRLAQSAQGVPYYVNVLPTGIQSHEKNNVWSLYPNPAQGELHIRTDYSLAGKNYRITDLAGRLITSSKYDGSSIDISSLENGSYLLQMENTSGGYSAQRFIKN
ncbi:MAG: PKD domain-containing protein [Bacteroidetes bacterium]|nr:PKD domain-containing protein [Bacteroidota bacterium]